MREKTRIADTQERAAAVDVARGLVIVGVVFNHVILGLTSASLLDGSSPLARFNDALYLFRMAALAVVLGLFIPAGVEKRGLVGYLRHRLPLLLYLYVLWSLLQGAVAVLASGEKNYPTRWSSVLRLWYPDGQLWFLPFLIVATTLLAVLRPWRRTLAAWLSAGGIVVLSVVACGSATHIAGLRGLTLVGFALVGSCIGLPRLARWLRGSTRYWLGATAVALGIFLLCWSAHPYPSTEAAPDGSLTGRLLSLLAAGSGVVLVLAAAAASRRVPLVQRLFASLGRRTLEVFLAHLSFASATRIGLDALHVHSLWIHVVLGVAIGVGAPLTLASLSARLRVRWLFQLPGAVQRIVDPPRPNCPIGSDGARGIASAGRNQVGSGELAGGLNRVQIRGNA